MPEPSAPRILIIRLSAVGDTVLALPVLTALRDHYPQATIAWLVEDRCASVLRGHPSLDEVIVAPRGWLSSPRHIRSMRRRLRQLRPEIAIDVQGLAKSAVAGWLSGARRRIGFVRGELQGREMSTWLNNELVKPSRVHVLERNLELLAPLGIKDPPVHFHVPQHNDEIAAIDRYLTAENLNGGFAILNVSTTWASKLWPLNRFAEVARHLDRAWQLPSLLTWGCDEDRRRAEFVGAIAGGHARLAPRWSLTGLGSLQRRARLMVSLDTGPLHLAAAVGTPCVGLYGPTPASRIGVYGTDHVRVQQVPEKSSSGAGRRRTNDEMRAISVDAVCAACDTVLSRQGDRDLSSVSAA